MKNLILITQRELQSYFNSMSGYIVVAIVLGISGLLFNTMALGENPKLSYDILAGTGPRHFGFFWVMFGTTTIASVFLTMRLISEERQSGTLVLMHSSGVKDWQIVLGKWGSALVFISFLLLCSTYIPALIFINGKVALSHIAVGYLGLFLAASMSSAIGVFSSSFTKSQVISALTSGVILAFFLLSWILARSVDAPFKEFFSYLSMFDRHFGRTFAKGQIQTRSIFYFFSMTTFFLLLAVRVMQTRRWK